MDCLRNQEEDTIAFINQQNGRISEVERTKIAKKCEITVTQLTFNKEIDNIRAAEEILQNEIKLINKKIELGVISRTEGILSIQKKFALMDNCNQSVEEVEKERAQWKEKILPILQEQIEGVESDLNTSQIGEHRRVI